jgi:hypothetical protein
MTPRDDDRSPPPDDDPMVVGRSPPAASHRGQVLRGIVAALACDTLFNVPKVLLLPHIRAANLRAAIGNLLLGVLMLVGYVGGRAAARAGLSHDDARSQWSMAWTVSVLSTLIAHAAVVARHAVVGAAHPAPTGTPAGGASGSLLGFFIQFTLVVLLVRFGFAMGTFAQAKRDGRAEDDKDEAGAD